MSNQMQDAVPDSLTAFVNLTKALEQFNKAKSKSAIPMQGPAGPTIAEQAEQAARAAVQPSAQQAPPPPEGQPAPPQGQPQPQQNGIAGIAQNAGTGAQIQAQQQQQAQQAMMAQAQQPPQQMAKGGIAGLNAHNMHGFKEGGVLGFARGEEVPKAKEPQDEEPKEESSSPIGRRVEEFSQNIKEGQDAARADYDKRQELLALKQQAQLKFGPSSDVAGLFMNQSDEDRTKAKQIMAALPNMNEEQLKALLSGAPFAEPRLPQDQASAMARGKVPVFGEKVDASAMADRLMAIQKAQRAGIASLPSEEDNTKAFKERVAGITGGFDGSSAAPRPTSGPVGGPPANKPVQQSGVDGMMSAVRAMQANTPSVDTSSLEKASAEHNALLAAQPPQSMEQLAAHRKAQAAMDKLNQSQDKDEWIRHLLSYGTGLMNRNEGAQELTYLNSEAARKKGAITDEEARAQLSGAIVDLQNAKLAGNKAAEIASIKEINALKTGNAERLAKTQDTAATAYSHIYGADVGERVQREHNQTLIAVEQMREKAQTETNSATKADANIVHMQNALTNNLNSKANALAKINTAFDNFPNIKMLTAQIAGGTELTGDAKTLYDRVTAQRDSDIAKETAMYDGLSYQIQLAMQKKYAERGLDIPAPVKPSSGDKVYKY